MSVDSLSRRTQLGFYGKLVFLAGEGNHDDRCYNKVVPVPTAGVRAARKFVELVDSGQSFQSIPPVGTEVTVAFTDASKNGGGFSALREGSVVEMDVVFDPSKLPTHHSMYTEALQLAVVLRKCYWEHRDTSHSVLSDTCVVYFTENNPLAWALTHQHSARAPAATRRENPESSPVPELVSVRLVGGWHSNHRSRCPRYQSVSQRPGQRARDMDLCPEPGSGPGATVVRHKNPCQRYRPDRAPWYATLESLAGRCSRRSLQALWGTVLRAMP